MAVAEITLNSFTLKTTGTDTVRTPTAYFTVPDYQSIESVQISYVTHNTYGGNTQDAALYLDITTRAHDNTWLAPGGRSLIAGVFTPGQHSYRFHLKSSSSATNDWQLGTIKITITYTPWPQNPGTINLNKSSMAAGDAVRVSLTAADAGITRTIQVFFGSEPTAMATLVTGQGAAAANYDWVYPLARCDKMPNGTSGTIKVKMAPSTGDPVEKTMTITVPSSVVPALTDFTADAIPGDVPLPITGFIQSKSRVALAMVGAAGIYGSTISAYKITGGGLDADVSSGNFGPFNLNGEITFTAKVTDSRGRTTQKTVTISMQAYGPPKLSAPDAYRANASGIKQSDGTYARLFANISFSSLDGDNSADLKGRVYERGGTPPAWTAMTPGIAWIMGGGLISVDRSYTAEIIVEDLMEMAIYQVTIPTKKTPLSILGNALGIAFGKVAETPGIAESAWPIYINGKRVLTEDDLPL